MAQAEFVLTKKLHSVRESCVFFQCAVFVKNGRPKTAGPPMVLKGLICVFSIFSLHLL